MSERPDPWEMAAEAGLAREFGHDLEAFVSTACERASPTRSVRD
jgi:hypothetical protein